MINIGIQINKANNDVSVGLNRVRNKLSNGTLFIHPSCENLIREIEGYQFKPGTEVVKKVGDDLCDCLRYIVMSRIQASDFPEERINPMSAWGKYLLNQRKSNEFNYSH